MEAFARPDGTVRCTRQLLARGVAFVRGIAGDMIEVCHTCHLVRLLMDLLGSSGDERSVRAVLDPIGPTASSSVRLLWAGKSGMCLTAIYVVLRFTIFIKCHCTCEVPVVR